MAGAVSHAFVRPPGAAQVLETRELYSKQLLILDTSAFH